MANSIAGSRRTMKMILRSYTKKEKKGVFFYILGIMWYKLGVECFQGSMTALALSRWGDGERYGSVSTLSSMNLVCQCLGMIICAQLLKALSTRRILFAAVLIYGGIASIIMIVDASTGGRMKHANEVDVKWGDWNPACVLFPTWCVAGLCHGMIELVRKVIPRDIVGGDVYKLKQLDSVVHIFYEIAGTAGAFMCTELLLRIGPNYALIVTPISYILATLSWWFIGNLNFEKFIDVVAEVSSSEHIKSAVMGFWTSISVGAQIIFSNRDFLWLPIGYSLSLYSHRYLENGLGSIAAHGYYKNGSYAQMLVCGSNIGELVGALAVLLFGQYTPTPIPWLRFDALMLLMTWVLPFYPNLSPGNVLQPGERATTRQVLKLAATFIPISLGWAAGDVSLSAYVQSKLSNQTNERTEPLAAVMACLLCIYIVIFGVMNPTLGRYADNFPTMEGTQKVLFNIGGIQYTVIAGFVVMSTFIPRGAWSFNPKGLKNQGSDGNENPEGSEASDECLELQIVEPIPTLDLEAGAPVSKRGKW